MEKISRGVAKIMEWKGTDVWYRIHCGCGCDNGCDIEFEIDKDFHMIHINFYKNMVWADYYKHDNKIKQIWSRIKASMVILFKGYIDMEDSFLIKDIDHMDSFITALKEGKEKMLQAKKEAENEKEKWVR